MTDVTDAGDVPPAPSSLTLLSGRALRVEWPGEPAAEVPVWFLRARCPCERCRGDREAAARSRLHVMRGTGEAVHATGARLVGSYAVELDFTDGHRTGFFTFRQLRALSREWNASRPLT